MSIAQPSRRARRLVRSLAALIAASILAGGCAGLQFLPEDEELYTGAEVEIESEDRIRGRRRLERDLEDGIRPQPNTSWFGVVRPGLWIYGAMGEREEGVRAWISERYGEPPVLLREVLPERTAETLRRRLSSRGFFDAELEYEIDRRPRRAGVTYRATVLKPFRIAELRGPAGDTALERAVRDALDDTRVEAGDVYSLETLREERSRIDRALKDDGFFYFNPDYLEYIARANPEDRTVDLELRVKPETPPRARRRYRVGNVRVLGTGLQPGAELESETRTSVELTPGIRYIGSENAYRAETLASAILLEPGEHYSRRRHLNTINRLMDLGVFQFVSVRYRETGDDETLDAEVRLTPMRERSLQAELRAVTKSNDYAGPGFNASYLDRNLFGGAEQLEVQLLSSFETRMDTAAWSLDAYELGVETQLSIPRILGPLQLGAIAGGTLPRTRIRTGYRSLTRLDAYRLDSFNAGFSYLWSTGEFSRHEWRPLEATMVRPRDFTAEFEELLEASPAVRRAFDEQLIVASAYSYRYNTQRDDTRRHHRYHGFEIETAGNVLHAARLLRHGEAPDEDDPYTLFGVPYAQYVRADFDNRAYFGVTERSRFATRLLTGAGQAYGNARSMPSIRQFSVGGTNSIRAFPARSIGPGAASRPEDGRFVERLGDMRLEGNLEYRFPLLGLLRGALFIDAGNIWNLGEDRDVSDSEFSISTALEELYVGTGVGLRLTTPFVVVRFDVAFPLREADRPAGERWVVDEIDFGDSGWRRNNLMFNLAIGYPF